jgi:DNA-binding NtrC family response regulator
MAKKKTILVVDDEYGARESLKVILEPDYEVIAVESCFQADSFIAKKVPHLILLDISMPVKNGIDWLKELRRNEIAIPVVMVSATQTLKTAVEAMKYGACDYITKPYNVEEIQAIVKETITSSSHDGPKQYDTSFSPCDIIGHDTSLKQVFKLIHRLSPTNSTVLISGESGTGKEMIARAVHYLSSRAAQPFIPIHLATLSGNLIESELFGHVKGAFTGADKDRKGAIEAAEEGSLFLDEIAEISEAVQIKLLRVIQEREFKAVGDNVIRKTNCRIIAATNKDLYKMVQEEKFRADLYYRLNVVPISLPPLRERTQDIPILTDFLLNKICNRFKMDAPKVAEEVMQTFFSYSWPGNIRELENTLENMILLCDEPVITESLLPVILSSSKSPGIASVSPDLEPINNGDGVNMLNAMERETIQSALIRNNGVLTSTAKYLGTTRRILKYKMDKLGIIKTELFRN